MSDTILPNKAATAELAVARDKHPDEGSSLLKDVWSRSGSTYRIRAIVLLAVNVLLFAGVASFAYWLRTGQLTPATDGYWGELVHTFRSVPMSEHTGVSLGSFLFEPINVQDVPEQIPIVGLLMATLISVPILVSILYRFWSSLPFIAVIGFLAVMPWLALTLLGSCLIASVRPFRTRFRFTSALLGLLPAVLYLILAWNGTVESVSGSVDPVERIKFIAPWVMAIVAATVIFATALTIARIVDYRPGAIAPLLAIMFGLPVALFEYHVGRDELYYRILYSLNQAHFKDQNASIELDQVILDQWSRRPASRRSMEATREVTEERWLMELIGDIGPDETALCLHQNELITRCDWFLHHFPQSRYAVNVLYLKARAMDMRVDALEFRTNKWIRYYEHFPQDRSRRVWRMILENGPDRALSAVALLRLAQLDARDCDLDRALDKLVRLRLERNSEPPELEVTAGAFGPAVSADSPAQSLGIAREQILIDAARLANLIRANRDPVYQYDPLCGPTMRGDGFAFGLLDLDPRSPGYVDNLRILKLRYPACQIEDNIDLEIAKQAPALDEQIRLLMACLVDFPNRDSVPEALFRIALAYKQNRNTAESDAAFQRLFQDHPESTWAGQAERFATPSTASKTGPRVVPGSY